MDKNTAKVFKTFIEPWENFEEIDVELYNVYDGGNLCNEEKMMFNLQFLPATLAHDDNGEPSKKLIDWVKLNNSEDKLEAFHLWGYAMHAAIYWGNNKFIQISDVTYRDVKINQKLLKILINSCELIGVADILFKTLGRKLFLIVV